MAILLGIDIGTTTLTALALDADSGAVVALATTANQAEITSPADKARGYTEWDVARMADAACRCLRAAVEQLGSRLANVAGLGITGQQHGGVIVDERLQPLTPLINWQDRRTQEPMPGSDQTYLRRAQELVGEDAPQRTGCRLHAGFMATTLFWMKEQGVLPVQGTACLIMDYFAALLTGQQPTTDATCGGSFGVLDLRAADWDMASLAALGLPRSLCPLVRPSGERVGTLTPGMAEATGLPAGLPVFGAIGDNQASFLGSVGSRSDSVLVNVGTGGQVAAFVEDFVYDPRLETRPFPRHGFLLVCPGLCGGRSYATLEQFFRKVGSDIFDIAPGAPLYAVMNRLAASVPARADGLRCEPFFTGTRQAPELRASWSDMSPENFAPGHMTRALLEGMARAFRSGYDAIRAHVLVPPERLIGAGNGMRENPLLAGMVEGEFELPLLVPLHREEAAFGAALMAGIGAGVFRDLDSAGWLIRYG
jgi:sugar (pentulose or hexulose) kinase